MYLAELRGEVSQGDIFDSLPTVYIQGVGLKPKVQNKRSTMLIYDCEYDKPRTTTVIIAEVWPLSDADPGSRGYIRQNRVFGAFYLEPYLDIIPESYVDFRTISRLEKSILEAQKQTGRRLVSLTDDSRLALQQQLSLFLEPV